MTRHLTRIAISASLVLLLALSLLLTGCGGSGDEVETTDVTSSTPAKVSSAQTPTSTSESLVSEAPTAPIPASPPSEASPEASPSPQAAFPDATTSQAVTVPSAKASGTGEEPALTEKVPVAQIAIVPAFNPQDEPGGQASAGRDSEPKGIPDSRQPVQGTPYTWQDGDRTLSVHLQEDLVVEGDGSNSAANIVRAQPGGSSIVAKGDGYVPSNDDLPVFRSQSGSLMTLPGGVLLVLNEEWTQAQTNSFFADNGIKMDRVSELGYITNGFFITTDPGFPSLNLANELAALDGVEVSSPNWWSEAVTR